MLQNLHGQQMAFAEADPVQVGIHQFHGLEINDFAVEVAKTALWIAELQMLEATREILDMWLEPLPLKDNANIHCANALRVDWNEVLPAEQCGYIIGNPPFIGAYRLDKEQQADRTAIFGKSGDVLDYVACWYKRAAEYTQGQHTRCAFVSTNSICQGQQVEPLWKPLFEGGLHIDFAHRTFIWNNESLDQAHVHCVIVGFSQEPDIQKTLFDGDKTSTPKNINGYLTAAPSVFVAKHPKPLCNVPEMSQGFKPADGGHLLMYREERDDFLAAEPESAKWIRPFSMGADFIKGDERFCLWLQNATPADIEALPAVKTRVESCREWRSQQIETGDAYKLKDTPHLLRPCNKFHDSTYIGVPVVTSGNRRYVPLGFVKNGMIPGNKLYFVESDSLYHFGVLLSQFHNAWMRLVTGRLKSDYNYSNTIVYNNFIWPHPTDAQKQHIEQCAQAVLDARAEHPDATLAQLYAPDKMPQNLRTAHQTLDAAVEAAYGVRFDGDEERIVEHLFPLYAQAAAGTKE